MDIEQLIYDICDDPTMLDNVPYENVEDLYKVLWSYLLDKDNMSELDFNDS